MLARASGAWCAVAGHLISSCCVLGARKAHPKQSLQTGAQLHMTTTFAALGVSPDLVEALDAAGIKEPFPIQAMTIADALAGRDICGKAKTGSGKTLAFGLPVIQMTTTARKRRPRALILVPTRELANQVADALTPFAAACELWVTAIYGGASMVRQIKALHAGVDVVIATPGRLNDLLERK